MTGYERIKNVLNHQPVDRIPVYEHFWDDVKADYVKKGYMKPEETMEDHFGLDMQKFWAFHFVAKLDYEPVIVSETETTVTILDGNGAVMKQHKTEVTTPEHISFTVTDRESWEEYKKYLTDIDERRIDFEGYRKAKEAAKKANRFFAWAGAGVFECMHPICGHENMLIGMILDPEWIEDMVDTYATLTVELQKILFEREGAPDGMMFSEDMGFKEKPFMSPEMYCNLIMPGHKKTINYAKSLGIPVIMHSCGYVRPLLPHMIEAGIDCLHALEVKAGMDLLEIHKTFGDKIAIMGGLDVRALCSNDKAEVDKELESKIPIVKNGYGFVLHTDHSIPKTVDYETYKYFIKKGLELGGY